MILIRVVYSIVRNIFRTINFQKFQLQFKIVLQRLNILFMENIDVMYSTYRQDE